MVSKQGELERHTVQVCAHIGLCRMRNLTFSKTSDVPVWWEGPEIGGPTEACGERGGLKQISRIDASIGLNETCKV